MLILGVLASGAFLLAPTGSLAAETSTALTATPNPSAYRQPVTLKARIRASGNGVPTGTVTFKSGRTALGKPLAVNNIGVGNIVETSGSHACSMTRNGGVRCWGFNNHGQLGDGTTTDSVIPIDVVGLTGGVAAIAVGGLHTCVLTTAGGVKCWGDNRNGQLGEGTFLARRLTPVDVHGLTSGVVAISAGNLFTCALTDSGNAKCWGANGLGQLGTGSTDPYTNIPADVVGLTGILTLATGTQSACALTSTGAAKCWGGNLFGELGDGTTITRRTPVDVVGLTSGIIAITRALYHTCALTTGGAVKCWGWNSIGQLGNGTRKDSLTPIDVVGLTSGVAAISAAGNHTCAVTTAGGSKCWGVNSWGQLGDGTDMWRLTPTDVVGLDSGVVIIAAGYTQTCAETVTGDVKCWGNNEYGQVGDGTRIHRYTPTDVVDLTAPLFGEARLTTAMLAVDTHSLTAEYSGDSKHAPSISDPRIQTVNRWPTAVSLATSKDPTVFGEGVTFTASVSVDQSGVKPTGMVTFVANGSPLATVPRSGKVWRYTTSSLAVGTHTITATYEGDVGSEPSTSPGLIHPVAMGLTATTLDVRPSATSPGRAVRLTANVTARGRATGTPTGTVMFLNRNRVLGSAALNAGAAVFNTVLPIGSHTLTARYEGSVNFVASQSTRSILEVNAGIGATLTIDSDADPDQATNKKHSPMVATLARGGFVVAWQSSAQDSSTSAIYARRYRENGTPVDNEFRVGAATGASQWQPSVAGLAGGDFIVVWEALEWSGYAVYGQRYTGTGPVGDVIRVGKGQGPAGRLAQAPTEATATPVIAGLTDGGFIVAWASDRQDGTGRNVYARRYTARAKPVGEEFRVNRKTANHQWRPSVAALSNGGFVVVWSSNAANEEIVGVVGQRYDATGETIGSEFRVATPPQHGVEPVVAGLTDDGFVVAFSARRGSPESAQNILIRRYDPEGPNGDVRRVNMARNKYQYAPSVASFANGSFLVAWTLEDESGSEIHARFYDASGQPSGAVFRIDPATSGIVGAAPSVATLAKGRAVVVWASQNLTAQQSSIRAQRLKLEVPAAE